ncbi:MAG: heavy-metal-associated domain-containing protein [Calditrichaeota bacterium]|nr:heavy-metal-associated domain-containing protein [Calditrichota bacterium]MCB9473083.1 heavy-metal-associated domain-containing protein [Candidatus Delongbacteria bacterium]
MKRMMTHSALLLLAACLLTSCGKSSEKADMGAAVVQAARLDTLVLAVNGMTCDGCVQTVSMALKKVPAVQSVVVSLDQETATVVVADAPADERDLLAAAITNAGYTVPTADVAPVEGDGSSE